MTFGTDAAWVPSCVSLFHSSSVGQDDEAVGVTDPPTTGSPDGAAAPATAGLVGLIRLVAVAGLTSPIRIAAISTITLTATA
ncbi:hypothetical protein [Nonomuraea sp. NPDC049141]|uniref:hypothetical protein n=1 Tax=Nonomuraea sp. NPDC049141 TaxID=3155500 RepID=UPI0033D12543